MQSVESVGLGIGVALVLQTAIGISQLAVKVHIDNLLVALSLNPFLHAVIGWHGLLRTANADCRGQDALIIDGGLWHLSADAGHNLLDAPSHCLWRVACCAEVVGSNHQKHFRGIALNHAFQIVEDVLCHAPRGDAAVDVLSTSEGFGPVHHVGDGVAYKDNVALIERWERLKTAEAVTADRRVRPR